MGVCVCTEREHVCVQKESMCVCKKRAGVCVYREKERESVNVSSIRTPQNILKVTKNGQNI